MNYALTILNWLLPLMYLGLLIDHAVTFVSGARRQTLGGWTLAVVFVHAAFLIARSVYFGHARPLSLSEVLSLTAICTAIIFWILQRSGRDRRAGVFIFLLVFLFQYTSAVLFSNILLPAAAAHEWQGLQRMHVLPAVFAYTALSLAGVHGLLHMIALRGLKQHRFGLLFNRLPALDQLGTATWHALLIGFVCVTVAMLTGPMLNAGEPLLSPKVAIKVVVGGTAWLLCLVAVAGKLLGKWPMVRISRMAVSVFAAIVILLGVSAAL